MIKATIHPPSLRPELLIDTHRCVLTLARQEQAALLLRARKRGRGYAKKARELGYNQGFAKGMNDCKTRFSSILDTIQNQYSSAIESARADAISISREIVEQVISSYVQEHPERLTKWITDALESLKHARAVTLRYNSRYADLLPPLIEHYQGRISIVSDSRLGDVDFAIETTTGGISFSWRELLRPLTDYAHHRGV